METNTSTTAAPSEQAYAVDASRARNLQLEIVTAEGDGVRLTLSDARAVQLAAYQAADSAASALSMGVTVAASGSLAYTLEGELSAEETAAIEALLGRVDELAGRFFSGDVAGLLRQVNDFGLDMEQLASFSLQMDMTRSVRAAGAYRSVQAMAADSAGNATPSSDLPAFIAELDVARTASAGRSDLFDELLKAAAELLNTAHAPASQGSGPGSAIGVLDRLLSALDAVPEPSAAEPGIKLDDPDAVEPRLVVA